MLSFIQYLVLVVVILLAATIFVLAYGIVAYHLHKLVSLIEGKRRDRLFFKKIARFRRDFT